MSDIGDYIKKLDECPLGKDHWSDFENLCTEILEFLFVPPLNSPTIQARTISEGEIRDAAFPNRNHNSDNSNLGIKNWNHLYTELNARIILVEYKNYDSTEIKREQVDQMNSYMRSAMGKLGIMVCSKEPSDSAIRKRNTIYNDNGRVIIFLTKEHLKEMLLRKERGEEPSDLIIDLIEAFYMQQE